MYWDCCEESTGTFCKHKEQIARKKHRCCECEKTIQIGERYSYFSGLWIRYDGSTHFGAFKTCFKCEKDWDEILDVFCKNGEIKAIRVFSFLKKAIKEAFDWDFLTENDRLVQEYLGIFPEADVKEPSSEERETWEKQEAFVRMKSFSQPLI